MLLVIFLLTSHQSMGYQPAEGNVTASFGSFVFKTNFKEAKTAAHAPTLPGLGLVVNGDISDHGSLEIAMYHMNKTYLRRDNQFFISEVSQVIHITMGYKWWHNPYLSSSLAIYSAYPMGNIRIAYNNFPTGTELPTSARDTTEYGLDWALQSQLWGGQHYDVVGEIRYSLSLTSREREEADHFGGFIGLRYLLQEKESDESSDEEKVKAD